MNMTAVKVDSSVKIDDEVTLLGDGIPSWNVRQKFGYGQC